MEDKNNGNNMVINHTIRSPIQISSSDNITSTSIPFTSTSSSPNSTFSLITSTLPNTTASVSTPLDSNTSEHREGYNNNSNNRNNRNNNKKYNYNDNYRRRDNNHYNNNNNNNNRSQYNNNNRSQHNNNRSQYNNNNRSQYNNNSQNRSHQQHQHQQRRNRSWYDSNDSQRYQQRQHDRSKHNERSHQHDHSQRNHPRQHNNQQQNYYSSKKKSYKDPSFVPIEFTFDPDPNEPYKLIDFIGGVNYTPSQDDGLIFNRVVKFFKDLITEVEQKNNLLDYNLYLQENQGFYVKIIQSDPTRYSPRKTLNCLSCDTESETNKMSKLPYPTTTREEVSIHHNLWVDAKARPMFIVTPKRHIERLSECNDQEIFSMFLLAIQIIEQETRLSCAKWNGVRFIRMTLNHGNARNVEHLHLKIKIRNDDFGNFKNCWDETRKKNFEILKTGLYKRDERLAKIS